MARANRTSPRQSLVAPRRMAKFLLELPGLPRLPGLGLPRLPGLPGLPRLSGLPTLTTWTIRTAWTTPTIRTIQTTQTIRTIRTAWTARTALTVRRVQSVRALNVSCFSPSLLFGWTRAAQRGVKHALTFTSRRAAFQERNYRQFYSGELSEQN